MPVKLKDDIYWVGAIDWSLRDFHGYTTFRGTTYNSYLIMDEKITLVDTVKAAFLPEMLERIREIVDPSKIDYLICNHIEMDHSGALPELVKLCPNAKVFCTKMAQTGLTKQFQTDLPIELVKTGDTLSLGKRNVHFLEIPMIHWPDSMMSYIPEDKLLLSNDGFGQHLASTGHFDDEVDSAALDFEASKYYANLLIHLSPLIQNVLQKVTEMELEIEMIAPSHGVIWRKDPGKIIGAYNDWSLYKAQDRVLVIYDTMWQSTERMAKTLVQAVADAGMEAKLLKLKANHRSDIMTDILDSKAFLVGSATMHRNLLPAVAGFLCYMKGLKPQKRVASAFGSYGWSGEAVQQITDVLNEVGLDVAEPCVKAQYRPTEEDNQKLKTLAKAVVDKVKAMD